MAGLIDLYGPDMPMPQVLAAISADSPRRLKPSQALTELCDAHTPQARALFGGGSAV